MEGMAIWDSLLGQSGRGSCVVIHYTTRARGGDLESTIPMDLQRGGAQVDFQKGISTGWRFPF